MHYFHIFHLYKDLQMKCTSRDYVRTVFLLQEIVMKASPSHPLLLRHQFKIAFYTEMKEEPANALK